MKPVRWGILSTAKIAREKIIPALRQGANHEIVAIASRTSESARAAAAKFGIPVAHGSYEALIDDPNVEAIYNPLPNNLHVPLTLAAARAGKHVLCEKPVAISADEAAQLREIGGKVLIVEAFMVRYHPQWLRVRELLRAGRIGELRSVQVFFSYFNADASNIRNRADIGGGALYDIGCYAIVAGRYFLEAEARRAIALIDRDPTFGTDRTTSGLVDFGGGRRLDFTVSTQSVPYQRVQLVGTTGRIEIQIPFNAPLGGTTRIFIDGGKALDGSQIETETLPESDQYTLQGDAFARAVRGQEALPYDVEDAITNMRVVDALFRSERSGRWEST